MIFAESLKKKKKREDDIKNLKSRFDPRFTMVALNFTGVIKNDFESRVCRQPINFSTPFLSLRTASISEGRRRWPRFSLPPFNSIFSPLEKLRGGGVVVWLLLIDPSLPPLFLNRIVKA